MELEKWIKKNKYDFWIKKYVKYFKRIFNECLEVRDEEVLIISDYGINGRRCCPLLAYGYYEAGKKLGLNVKVLMQDVKKNSEFTDKKIEEELKKLRKGIIVVLASNKLGKLRSRRKFRSFCKEKGHKFVTTPSIGGLRTGDIFPLMNSMNVDFDRISKEGGRIKKKLDNARSIRVLSWSGSDIVFDVKGRKAFVNDGKYNRRGKGGNIPCGEVFIAPKSCEGRVIVDGSSRNKWGTVIVHNPIKLEVRKGFIADIKGGVEAKLLARSINWTKSSSKRPSGLRTIGELGIGINDKAKVIGSMIVDEKTKGTFHIGIGSNYWFGGNILTTVHLDQVVYKPRFFIDGAEFIF